MTQNSVPRSRAAAILLRVLGAIAVYISGIAVLLLKPTAPIMAITIAGLIVAGAVLGQWWRTLHQDSDGNNRLANLGLILATIGFFGALFATLVNMDLAVTGSSFVLAGAGMCLGAVRS